VVTLPLPARVGYDFSKWYNTADFSGESVSAIPANAVGNRIFYAKWTAKIYTITYITNGGMLPDGTITSYTIESPTITLPIPTRNAYMFLNWRFMNETGTVFDRIVTGSVGNYTFFATWTPTVYNIKYNVYDGTMPNEYATTYTIESETITLPRPTMVGHVFVGWYDNKELSGVPIREITKGSYGNLEFFASWRRLIYTVKFVDWDYETELGSVNVEHGSAITNPPTAPEHYGYDFTGWDKDITCVLKSMTVAAVYELTSYSVVFVDIDYYVLSSQQVKHGHSAIAPTPPQREGSVFAFWSCDFSYVTSDLTVIAVYRTTTVTPTQQPLRFVQADSLNAGEHYIFAVKNSEGEQFALSVLDRLSGNGLWGIEIKVDRRGIMPQSETNNLDEVIFIANTGNEGFRLANIMSGEYLTASDGYVQMKNMFPLYADSFNIKIIDGKGYLYNAKRDVYLSYDNDGYFKNSNVEGACEVIVYKHIKISADYVKVNNPELGKNYYVVAQKSGVSYALSYKNGAISTIPVDIIDNKLYFYDNINERVPAFRFMYGDNQKGFNVRCVGDSGFLGVVNNSYFTTSDMLLAGFFVYQQFEDTENYVFLDYLSNRYLYCDDFGNISADTEHSNVLLFERVPKDGRMGDVNMDASVNTGDATLMLRHIVGKITLNETQLKVFDTNVDRHNNTGDVTHLLRFVVGEIDWLGE
ncbi:MAG: hypothetical protein GX802_06180, partial [Clostridiales bacterium]|nr:hypothetical protein [Clostridiales bacterium]